MSERTAIARAAESSAVLRNVVRCSTWLRQTNARLAVGFRSRSRPSASPEQLRMLAEDSLTVRALSRLVDIPVDAWHDSSARRLVDGILTLDLAVRMSLLGWMVLAAIVTHIVILATLGIRVYLLGWAMRLVLLLLAIALIARPAAFAAAWRDRRERSHEQ